VSRGILPDVPLRATLGIKEASARPFRSARTSFYARAQRGSQTIRSTLSTMFLSAMLLQSEVPLKDAITTRSRFDVGHVEHPFLAPSTEMAWRLFVNSESCLLGYRAVTRKRALVSAPGPDEILIFQPRIGPPSLAP